jgi:DNA-directed RNA polymerase subunit RPC12/RpoP
VVLFKSRAHVSEAMRTNIRKAKIEFECTECGKTLETTFQDAIDRKSLVCPKCGTKIVLEPDESLNANLREFDHSLDKLKKMFK